MSGSPAPRLQVRASAAWHPAERVVAANAAVGLAPYFVVLDLARLVEAAVVTDALTGKELAVVRPPARGMRFTAVSAAGDDRTFVLAAQPTAPPTRFYELRLAPDGRARPLVLLRGPAVAYAATLAVSVTGSKLAIATGSSDKGIIVIDSLATGRVRTWKARGGSVSDLSWAGDRFLAFQWWGYTRSARASSDVRLLDTTAAGTNLLAARVVLAAPDHTKLGDFTGLGYPLMSADGSRLFATMTWGGKGNPMAEVVEFSARTRHALAAVSPASGESGMGGWCGAYWTDPSGVRAAVTCHGAEGQTDNGHCASLELHAPHYNFSVPRDSFIAW